MQEKIFLSKTAIFSDIWGEELEKQLKKSLEVDGVVYKYRVYFKTIWKDVENPDILTFIMLNPSRANQYSNDPSVNNCIKIAKNSGFDGIEVLNIYALRHPVFAKIKDKLEKEGNPKDINYDMAQFRNIVLAWGNKKITPKQNETLFKKFKEAKILYILGVQDNKKIKKVDKYNMNQIRHPDNRAWTNLGTIDNARLLEVDKELFLEQGLIKCQNKKTS